MKFNRLTLIERDCGRTGDNHVLSRWSCDCGGEAVIAFSRVKNGYTHSCGCLIGEMGRARIKHGEKRTGGGTREYGSWQAMRRRCENPEDKDYPRYGGRGITVCARWSEFANFRADMGDRPKGMTLERVDSMGNYEPGNVKWGDHFEQARNRRSSMSWSIKGVEFTCIGDAAEHFSVSCQTIHRWVNGAFDARRGTFTQPRADCKSERKYA